MSNIWPSIKKHLSISLIGYVILAGGIAYTIHSERVHSSEARRALAVETRDTLIQNCRRGNILRKTLQELILAGIPTSQKYVEEGLFTQKQAARAIKQTREAAKKVAPIDCLKVYPVVEKKK